MSPLFELLADLFRLVFVPFLLGGMVVSIAWPVVLALLIWICVRGARRWRGNSKVLACVPLVTYVGALSIAFNWGVLNVAFGPPLAMAIWLATMAPYLLALLVFRDRIFEPQAAAATHIHPVAQKGARTPKPRGLARWNAAALAATALSLLGAGSLAISYLPAEWFGGTSRSPIQVLRDRSAPLPKRMAAARELRKQAVDQRADLSGARLGGAPLGLAQLAGVDLSDAELLGANLTGANLRGAKLRRANLNSANLTGADLSNADLQGASFDRTNLLGAKLRGADLRGANFLLPKALDQACGDAETRLPERRLIKTCQ